MSKGAGAYYLAWAALEQFERDGFRGYIVDPKAAEEFREIMGAFRTAFHATSESQASANASHDVERPAPVTADLPKAEEAQGRTGVPASLDASEPARPVDRSRSLDEATLWGK